MKLLIISFLLMSVSTCQPKKSKSIVMMGDSITSEWFRLRPEYFAGKSFVNKGISGETTRQMLERFQKDVIANDPYAVIILAGTNDIAQNEGPVSITKTFENIKTMAEMARIWKIEVILCSVLPAYDYPWKPGLGPDKKIPELNSMIRQHATEQGFTYINYFDIMKDEKNGIKKELARDGVHPVVAGYEVMEPLLEAAVKVLKR